MQCKEVTVNEILPVSFLPFFFGGIFLASEFLSIRLPPAVKQKIGCAKDVAVDLKVAKGWDCGD